MHEMKMRKISSANDCLSPAQLDLTFPQSTSASEASSSNNSPQKDSSANNMARDSISSFSLSSFFDLDPHPNSCDVDEDHFNEELISSLHRHSSRTLVFMPFGENHISSERYNHDYIDDEFNLIPNSLDEQTLSDKVTTLHNLYNDNLNLGSPF
jgi:hypothetical protein